MYALIIFSVRDTNMIENWRVTRTTREGGCSAIGNLASCRLSRYAHKSIQFKVLSGSWGANAVTISDTNSRWLDVSIVSTLLCWVFAIHLRALLFSCSILFPPSRHYQLYIATTCTIYCWENTSYIGLSLAHGQLYSGMTWACQQNTTPEGHRLLLYRIIIM